MGHQMGYAPQLLDAPVTVPEQQSSVTTRFISILLENTSEAAF